MEDHSTPTVFISYSWDSEEHRNWVASLANDLMRHGIRVIIDKFDLKPGDDKFDFMERSVTVSDHVLVICTPNYIEKVQQKAGGVGEETQLITPEFYKRHQTKKRFIPIIRASASNSSPRPRYLESLIHLDFQDDNQKLQRLGELLDVLIGYQSEAGHNFSVKNETLSLGSMQFEKMVELLCAWHPKRRSMDRSIQSISQSESYPNLLSIDGQIAENPVYINSSEPEVIKLLEGEKYDSSNVRIMPMDIFLVKAIDSEQQPRLLQYFSGNPSSGWDTWLFPHGYHLNTLDNYARMEKNARDFEVDIGVRENSVAINLVSQANFCASFKPDFGYQDRVVLYIFTFCSCEIRSLAKHLRNETFEVRKGSYSKKFRWSHLEDLRADKSVYSKNGDLLRAIHSLFHNSLANVPNSFRRNGKIATR